MRDFNPSNKRSFGERSGPRKPRSGPPYSKNSYQGRDRFRSSPRKFEARGEALPLPTELFITCQPTLEELLFEELTELGIGSLRVGFAGVFAENSLESIYKINYCSRLAGRVLLPMAAFNFYSADALYKQALDIEWSKWLSADSTFAIRTNGESPSFNNTLYASQKLKDALCDQFREKEGKRPSVNVKAPKVLFQLFLDNNKATVYFDTSLEPLFKRSWRREAGSAPLQETMAAAILRIAGYKGEGLLCDPCCGAGTLLVEAALIATHTPSGFKRTVWGFEQLAIHDKALWDKVRLEADSKKILLRPDSIIGIDVHKDSLRMAKANLISAGFQDEVTLLLGDFIANPLEQKFDTLVANPPHGVRLGQAEWLTSLYRSLGDFIKQNGKPGAKAFIYTSSLELSHEIGLKADQRHVISSSGRECRIIEISVH